MSTASGVATAVTFVWLGMVLAISFLEAPLKFRAPGVELRTGLAIGRVVFRALNAVEAVLAIALLIAVFAHEHPVRVIVAAVVAAAALAAQIFAVRPGLNRRTDAVLAGEDTPRSRAHYAYIGLEMVKVLALIVTGILLLV